MSQLSAVSEGTALSRELAEFLIELSIALHKHAIYPDGHPLVESAVVGVVLRLGTLLQESGTLSLGVARQQLVIEGVATDPNHPLLRELAARLHRQHLGAVRMSRGIDSREISGFLRAVAADVARTDKPMGLGPAEALKQWEHIALYPLTFGHLELLDEDADDAPQGEAGTRAAQLWLGLARAAMAADVRGDDASSTDPALVAKAIDDHQREVAYDQVIVGYLLQIAEELKSKGGSEAVALQRRVSQLVSRLQPHTLRQLLQMSGNRVQRRKFVLDATQGMAVDAVVELVKAAADTSKQTISHSLVRLLSKLAVHAEHGTQTMRQEADTALRDHVQRLIGDWDLEDPNPDSYRSVLERMARTGPVFAPSDAAVDTEPDRIVRMSLEAGALGAMVWRAVDAMIGRGRLVELLELLEGAPAASRETADEIWRHVATPERLRGMLGDRMDAGLVERVAGRMRVAAAEPLFDLLETAKERATRWKTLDLLTQIGPDVGPLAVARLANAPWYLQRNLLVLLSRLPSWPPGFTPLAYANNADARVRREAVKMLLRDPATRERAMYAALGDPDERVVHMAFATASESCPKGAVPLILARLKGHDLPPETRVLGIRALAAVRSPDVAELLLRHVLAGKNWLGRPKLALKSPEMLAALAGLASHWRGDARVAAVLAAAASQPDAEIRAAAAPPAMAARRTPVKREPR